MVRITREQAESRIRNLLIEIARISMEYGSASCVNASVRISDGTLSFNNRYWGEDSRRPIDYYESDIEF